MERKAGPVKETKRRYDGSRRREQARLARERALDVALERFLADGFAGTTIAGVAEEAGVSPDTIYKSFGGKSGLVRALTERGLEGSARVPAEQRSDQLQENESDPRELMRGIGRLAAEVAPRVAPLQLLMAQAAHADPEMGRLRAEFDRTRLERMTRNAERLARRGLLREGLSVERAGEIMWFYSSPEMFRLLVQERGWPLPRFGEFVAEALAAALLPEQ
jgi:AcrR family transcriptional regulator